VLFEWSWHDFGSENLFKSHFSSYLKAWEKSMLFATGFSAVA
jgi:hypothetical protein